MLRSPRANTVPCAMTNRLRSLASRVMTSCVRPSAKPPFEPPGLHGRRRASQRSRRGVMRRCGGGRARFGSPRSEHSLFLATAPTSLVRLGVLPHLTNRRPVESFSFEKPLGRSQMLFALTNTSMLRERDQQRSCAVFQKARARATSPDSRTHLRSQSEGFLRDARGLRRGTRGNVAAAW